MVWLSVFISFLTLLATCRVTRLVTEDTITKPVRDWLHMKAQPRHARPAGRAGGRAGGKRRLYGEQYEAADPSAPAPAPRPAPRVWRYASKLVTCPWCAGFWVSLALTLAYYRLWLGLWPSTWHLAFAFFVSVFALSWVSALLADWLDAPAPPKEQVHSGYVNVQLTQPPTP